MRESKSIHIGKAGAAGRDVTVLEVSVSQLGDAMTLLSQVSGGQGQNLPALAGELLTAQDGPARRLLHGMTDLGQDIDTVGGCALMDICETWIEVNRDFFDRLREAGNKLGRQTPADPAEAVKPQAA